MSSPCDKLPLKYLSSGPNEGPISNLVSIGGIPSPEDDCINIKNLVMVPGASEGNLEQTTDKETQPSNNMSSVVSEHGAEFGEQVEGHNSSSITLPLNSPDLAPDLSLEPHMSPLATSSPAMFFLQSPFPDDVSPTLPKRMRSFCSHSNLSAKSEKFRDAYIFNLQEELKQKEEEFMQANAEAKKLTHTLKSIQDHAEEIELKVTESEAALSRTRAELVQERSQSKQKLSELAARLESSESERHLLEKSFKEKERLAEKKLQDHYELNIEVCKENDKLKTENSFLQNQIIELKKRHSAEFDSVHVWYQKELLQLQQQLEMQERTVSGETSQARECTCSNSVHSAALFLELQGLKTERDQLRAECDIIRDQCKIMKREKDEALVEIEVLRGRNSGLKEKKEETCHELGLLHNLNSSLAKTNEDSLKAMGVLQSQISILKKEKEDALTERDVLQECNVNLRKELEDAIADRRVLRAENTKLALRLETIEMDDSMENLFADDHSIVMNYGGPVTSAEDVDLSRAPHYLSEHQEPLKGNNTCSRSTLLDAPRTEIKQPILNTEFALPHRPSMESPLSLEKPATDQAHQSTLATEHVEFIEHELTLETEKNQQHSPQMEESLVSGSHELSTPLGGDVIGTDDENSSASSAVMSNEPVDFDGLCVPSDCDSTNLSRQSATSDANDIPLENQCTILGSHISIETSYVTSLKCNTSRTQNGPKHVDFVVSTSLETCDLKPAFCDRATSPLKSEEDAFYQEMVMTMDEIRKVVLDHGTYLREASEEMEGASVAHAKLLQASTFMMQSFQTAESVFENVCIEAQRLKRKLNLPFTSESLPDEFVKQSSSVMPSSTDAMSSWLLKIHSSAAEIKEIFQVFAASYELLNKDNKELSVTRKGLERELKNLHEIVIERSKESELTKTILCEHGASDDCLPDVAKKAREKVNSLAVDLESCRTDKVLLENQIKGLRDEMKKLQEDLTVERDQLNAECQGFISQKNEEVKVLQKKINEAQENMKKQNVMHRDELKDMASNIEKLIKQRDLQKETLEKLTKYVEEIKEQSSKEKTEMEKKIVELQCDLEKKVTESTLEIETLHNETSLTVAKVRNDASKMIAEKEEALVRSNKTLMNTQEQCKLIRLELEKISHEKTFLLSEIGSLLGIVLKSTSQFSGYVTTNKGLFSVSSVIPEEEISQESASTSNFLREEENFLVLKNLKQEVSKMLEFLEKRDAEFCQSVEAAKETISDIHGKMKMSESEIDDLLSSVASVQECIAQTRAEREALISRSTELEACLHQKSDECDDLKKSLEDQADELEELKELANKLESNASHTEQLLGMKKAALDALQKTLLDVEQKKDLLVEDLAKKNRKLVRVATNVGRYRRHLNRLRKFLLRRERRRYLARTKQKLSEGRVSVDCAQESDFSARTSDNPSTHVRPPQSNAVCATLPSSFNTPSKTTTPVLPEEIKEDTFFVSDQLGPRDTHFVRKKDQVDSGAQNSYDVLNSANLKAVAEDSSQIQSFNLLKVHPVDLLVDSMIGKSVEARNMKTSQTRESIVEPSFPESEEDSIVPDSQGPVLNIPKAPSRIKRLLETASIHNQKENDEISSTHHEHDRHHQMRSKERSFKKLRYDTQHSSSTCSTASVRQRRNSSNLSTRSCDHSEVVQIKPQVSAVLRLPESQILKEGFPIPESFTSSECRLRNTRAIFSNSSKKNSKILSEESSKRPNRNNFNALNGEISHKSILKNYRVSDHQVLHKSAIERLNSGKENAHCSHGESYNNSNSSVISTVEDRFSKLPKTGRKSERNYKMSFVRIQTDSVGNPSDQMYAENPDVVSSPTDLSAKRSYGGFKPIADLDHHLHLDLTDVSKIPRVKEEKFIVGTIGERR